MKKLKVFVIDDSALIRAVLTRIINSQSDMEVVGAAGDPLQAREKMRDAEIDVVTLDVEMPKMDGIEFLEKLMRLKPLPVLMISTLTERGADVTMRALELGAVDFVTKPKLGVSQGMQEATAEITAKIRAVGQARVAKRSVTPVGASGAARVLQWNKALGTEKLIAIGSSTGGTEAVKDILVQLPADSPAVVITQHMPPGFTASWAQRLDGLCKINVREARHGERILAGNAYIAPGGQHLAVQRSGATYSAVLSDDPPVNRHKPSVEVLFRSVARSSGPNAAGIMLTGMGKDGATAMLELRNAGAFNIAQDEATCVVFGMPREAIAVGAVHEILPIQAIARRVLEHLGGAAGVPMGRLAIEAAARG